MAEPKIHYGDDALKFLDETTLDQFARHSERQYDRPGVDFEELVRRQRERFQDILDPKQVAVLTKDDQAVSIAGFWEVGRTPDGRPVVEVGRTVTLETHRGNGYSPQVMQRTVDEIRTSRPNAVIVLSTEFESVAKNAVAMGFESIGLETYRKYREVVEETWTEKKKKSAEAYRYFQLDPLKNISATSPPAAARSS